MEKLRIVNDTIEAFNTYAISLLEELKITIDECPDIPSEVSKESCMRKYNLALCELRRRLSLLGVTGDEIYWQTGYPIIQIEPLMVHFQIDDDADSRSRPPPIPQRRQFIDLNGDDSSSRPPIQQMGVMGQFINNDNINDSPSGLPIPHMEQWTINNGDNSWSVRPSILQAKQMIFNLYYSVVGDNNGVYLYNSGRNVNASGIQHNGAISVHKEIFKQSYVALIVGVVILLWIACVLYKL